MNYPTFEGLAVSSKFGICGLPIRIDSYKTCSFGCKYCFSNSRKVMEFKKELQVANLASIKNRIERVIGKQSPKENNFLDQLISQNITWHCGGMSDPFQPVNQELKITNEIIDITSKYGISILFSTKSDCIHDANIRPDLHSFQLSITNVDNRKDIEPNVPDINKRKAFFDELKKDGFKVGIRIQPFIPNVTTLDIIKMFDSADHFTIEGLKIVPQNTEQKLFVRDGLSLPLDVFVQKGLLNIKPETRLRLYEPFIDYFESHGISFSISDNDLRYIGNNSCCCGDSLVHKATTFNTTHLIKNFWGGYKVQDVVNEITKQKVNNCRCADLFTSNRTQGCKTVEEVIRMRFNQASCPFSPKFQYHKPLQYELF